MLIALLFSLLLSLLAAIHSSKLLPAIQGATGCGAYRSPWRSHHGQRANCLWSLLDFLGQIGLGESVTSLHLDEE